jgi:hypothetical protein
MPLFYLFFPVFAPAQDGQEDNISQFVQVLLNQFHNEVNYLQNIADEEDNTSPATVDEFVFLSGFDWLRKEAEFCTTCKLEYGIPINDEMLECINYIIQEKWFLLTFRNLVIVTRIK